MQRISHIARQNSLPPVVIRRALREAAGLSQNQLAQQIDVTRETVSRWETGSHEPTGDKRVAYAAALFELQRVLGSW
jgi:transcriptional regulator with XRE-family HTH domain